MLPALSDRLEDKTCLDRGQGGTSRRGDAVANAAIAACLCDDFASASSRRRRAIHRQGHATETASVQGMPWSPGVWKVPADELRLLEFGPSIGASVALDGAARFDDLAVVDEGADVLWLTLRCARMNNRRKTKARLHELFDQARDCAKRASGSRRRDSLAQLQGSRRTSSG